MQGKWSWARIAFPIADMTAVFDFLHRERIAEWGLRFSGERFSVCMYENDLPRLYDCGFRGERIGTYGVAHLAASVKARSALLLGVVLMLFLFFFCRSRVWSIEIKGELDSDFLREVLFSCGLREGMALRELSTREVENAVLQREPGIAWIAVSVEGVQVHVEYIPRVAGEEGGFVPSNVGANVTAAYDAVICDISASRGTPVVRVGEVVKAGDLLISGVRGYGTVYAEGTVIGRVTRRFCVEVPFETVRERVLEKKTRGIAFSLFGKTIPLFRAGKGEVTEIIRAETGEGVLLPFCLIREIEYITTEEPVHLGENEVVRIARQLAYAELDAALEDAELVSRKTEGIFTESGYTLVIEVEYLTNIAKTLEFSKESE